MGAEIVAGALAGGSALLGHRSEKRAQRAAQNQAAEQRAHFQRQEEEVRAQAIKAGAETARISNSIQQTQQKINAGVARGNRGRIRGGLFGGGGVDEGAPLTKRLGT